MLKGTLDDFTLPDIFRFLAAGKKTGCVEITGTAGDGRVFLRDGDVYYGESSRTRGLDQEPTPETIQMQIEDSFFDLLRWDLTEFTYSSGVEVQPGAAIDLNVDALIEETSRKLEELEVIATKIPNEEAVMIMAPNPPADGEINISPEEWRVLVLVSGTRSVTDIADSVGRDSFSVMRTLYGLASHGLIEVVEAPAQAAAAAPSEEAVAESEVELEEADSETSAYIEALSSPLDGSELAAQMDAEFPPLEPHDLSEELSFDAGAAPPEDDASPLAATDDTEAAEGTDELEAIAAAADQDDVDGYEAEAAAIFEDEAEDEGDTGSDDDGSGAGAVADLEGAEQGPEPEDIPVEETTSESDNVVDRLAAVKELADLFEKVDDGHVGPPYPAELAAQRVAAGVTAEVPNGDGRRRVEDDEEITRGLISRLIDGVKGL